MTQPNGSQDANERAHIFRGFEVLRDITRTSFIECDCDPVATQAMAESVARVELKGRLQTKYGSLLGAIIFALIVNLISGLIADLIREWLARGIKSPSLHYQSWEPGYVPFFEDDET